MAYKDRLPQLLHTLTTISQFEFLGEIVICDDFSDESQNAKLVISKFPNLDIKVVCPSKKYNNPCMAYNQAIQSCSKEIIILQNPECCWMGDISKSVQEHIGHKKYITFACLSIPKAETIALQQKKIANILEIENVSKWINHSKKRPCCFHFCAAIQRSDLYDYLQGGFDEQFADGVCFDDTEFIFRVRKERFTTYVIDDPFVVHQWHPKTWKSQLDGAYEILYTRNQALFNKTVLTYKSQDYSGKFPKH